MTYNFIYQSIYGKLKPSLLSYVMLRTNIEINVKMTLTNQTWSSVNISLKVILRAAYLVDTAKPYDVLYMLSYCVLQDVSCTGS